MSEFPVNVLQVLDDRISVNMGDFTVVQRPLRPMDPAMCIGVYSVDWRPNDDPEIGHGIESTTSQYNYRIQLLVKHTTEVEGRIIYAKKSKILRAILYRDDTLKVQLTGLSETTLGRKERVQRFGIGRQQYLNNEFGGQFVYLSTTDFWVEVESTPV